jgi:hypothetical protein
VGVFRSGNPWVTLFDPKFTASNGAANPTYLMPASTAGVLGYRPFVYGPGWYNIDLSVNKSIPIRESIRFTFQSEFLNLTNHPTFSFVNNNVNQNNLAILGTSFAQTTNGNFFSPARRVEFRANLEF